MSRKSLPKAIETNLLLQSRRRCCLCFGLNRDTRLKSGQIAHLDRNRENDDISNLAFLCFEHHDVYDSISSQRKNYTIGEVKELRSELYATIGNALAQDVHFGQITTPVRDPYAGSYIRIDCGPDSAELQLTPLPDSYEGEVQYYVSGLALWGADRPRGPNLGTLEFIGVLRESREITHVRHSHSNERVVTCLMFSGDGHMSVDEDNVIGEYGMNVSFSGTYRRA